MRLVPASVLTTVCALSISSCTNDVLKDNTLNMAKAVTPFQYEMVLNNMAMISVHKGALPSMVRIGTAESQVADKIDPALKLTWGGGKQPQQEFDLGPERAWYSKFTTTPVTDPQDLRRSQLLFQYVLQTETDDDIAKIDLILGYLELPTSSSVTTRVSTTTQPTMLPNATGGTVTTTTTITTSSQIADRSNDLIGDMQTIREELKDLKIAAQAKQPTTKPKLTMQDLTTAPSASLGPADVIPEWEHLQTLRVRDQPWFHVWSPTGGKFPPPGSDCFVGHYGTTIVWVDRDHEEQLSLFTLYLMGYATANTARFEQTRGLIQGPLLTPN